MKVITILGTRPEIIRMACIIKELDKYCQNVLVHTGQNYDVNLRDKFFDDLDLRYPDVQLDVNPVLYTVKFLISSIKQVICLREKSLMQLSS